MAAQEIKFFDTGEAEYFVQVIHFRILVKLRSGVVIEVSAPSHLISQFVERNKELKSIQGLKTMITNAWKVDEPSLPYLKDALIAYLNPDNLDSKALSHPDFLHLLPHTQNPKM